MLHPISASLSWVFLIWPKRPHFQWGQVFSLLEPIGERSYPYLGTHCKQQQSDHMVLWQPWAQRQIWGEVGENQLRGRRTEQACLPFIFSLVFCLHTSGWTRSLPPQLKAHLFLYTSIRAGSLSRQYILLLQCMTWHNTAVWRNELPEPHQIYLGLYVPVPSGIKILLDHFRGPFHQVVLVVWSHFFAQLSYSYHNGKLIFVIYLFSATKSTWNN